METPASDLPWKSLYKLLIGSVVPRPIGWISTVDADGRPNLAPFSFFTVAGASPPMLVFAPMVRSTDGGIKDTLANCRATGAFVVNIAGEDLAEAVSLTSTELPAGVDEFALAGLRPVPAAAVRAPRVGESKVHFECEVHQIIELGSGPGAASLVIGRIVHVHVDESVLIGGDKIDLRALRPIGRLAGNAYCRVTDVFELERPKSQIKPA